MSMSSDDEIQILRGSGANLWERILSRFHSTRADLLYRRPLAFNSAVPVISFTFDDFPRSALLTGGSILNKAGSGGTYFACMGLMGRHLHGEEMFRAEDLPVLLSQGHELGCHTFHHYHSADTPTPEFERSVLRNQQALQEVLPDAKFQTFSYPMSAPRASTKQMLSDRFVCCRGDGKASQTRSADLNYLSSVFIEHHRDHPEVLRNAIEENRKSKGWLIFSTHDVRENPSPYGCTPELFGQVVEWAVQSGARVLPMLAASKELGVTSPASQSIVVPASVPKDSPK
jgi:peptidoglycan/xylan/chitin deacetylase (PgdA/CDA1 family)